MTYAVGQEVFYDHYPAYSLWVMLKFGILPALLTIPIFYALLLSDRKGRAFACYLLAVTLPFFYFIFRHNIFPDLPWFLRRFVTVLVPLAMLSFAVTLFRAMGKRAAVVALAYLALVISITAPVMFVSDHAGTVSLAAEVNAHLPDDGLVLADRYMLGDYSLGPLLRHEFGKDAESCSPYEPLNSQEIGDRNEVYLVTTLRNLCFLYKEGLRVFDNSVKVIGMEVLWSKDVQIPYVIPTAQLDRGAYRKNWTFTDYRVALSLAEVPSHVARDKVTVVLVRLLLE